MDVTIGCGSPHRRGSRRWHPVILDEERRCFSLHWPKASPEQGGCASVDAQYLLGEILLVKSMNARVLRCTGSRRYLLACLDAGHVHMCANVFHVLLFYCKWQNGVRNCAYTLHGQMLRSVWCGGCTVLSSCHGSSSCKALHPCLLVSREMMEYLCSKAVSTHWDVTWM